MATVTRSNIAPLHDKISVKLVSEDYLPGFEKALKQHAKQANVPGFRKGHVPAGMVKKMYGPGIYQEEILRNAGKALEDYLRAENLAIFGNPMAVPGEEPVEIDMAKPSEMEFHFEVGLKPEFGIPTLESGTVLPYYKAAVTEEMIEDEVKRIRRQFGTVEDLEVTETADDLLHLSTETAPEETPGPVLIANLPEALRSKAIGLKAGDTLTITPATDIEDPKMQDAFMKQVIKAEDPAQEYTLNVIKAGRVAEAEVAEGLFMQAFPNEEIADEAAFRTRLQTELDQQLTRMATERLDREIFENLVHTTPIELPKDFLKMWMVSGSGDDQKPKSPEQVEKEFPGFEHQLRWSLISDKLFNDMGVRVTADDVKEVLQGRVLGYFGMADMEDAPWMESYMKQVMKDEKTVNETYQSMMMERLFAALREKIATEEKTVDEKEFFALPAPGEQYHNHSH
jgi:trigger factor